MKSVPVLTAVSDAAWEADLVAATERDLLGVKVVRRCVDLADLLATAATGQARAVVLSADLRRLDREALSRLAHARVAVVGLVPPGDLEAERRLARLGVLHVLPADSTVECVSATLLVAAQQVGHPAPSSVRSGSAMAWGDPRPAPVDGGGQGPDWPAELESASDDTARQGQIVAVWGPHGAPGRTTVAVGLASELAALGQDTLLVDADVYGGVVAQLLGLLDEAPGLAAAARVAGAGGLDLAALVALARSVAPGLRVLTGIARPDRWLELRPSALEVVLERAREVAAFTVVDCGFCLERDEELSFDTAAPRRNGATLEILQSAEVVVAVGSADPVGLQRLIRGIGDLREVLPEVTPTVVVNRVRSTAIEGDAGAQIRAVLARYAGVEQVHLVPMDVAGLDAAAATGQTLQESSPGSPARQALIGLAAELAGVAVALPARRRWRALRRRPA